MIRDSDGLCKILSALYGKLLVILGFALPLSKSVSNKVIPAYYEAFYIYLYVGSLLFIAYVYIFLINPKTKLPNLPTVEFCNLSKGFTFPTNIDHNGPLDSTATSQSTFEDETGDASFIKFSQSTPFRKRSNTNKISYQTEGNFGSFYLRLGALAFGAGGVIYGLLEVGQYLEPEEVLQDCENFIALINPACRSLFIFAQMYFIFLNTKLTIYKYKKFARFGLMHMVATNLCVWMNVLIEETNHELHSYMEKNGDHYVTDYGPDSIDAITTSTDSYDYEANGSEIHQVPLREVGYDENFLCRRTNSLGKMVVNTAPFLFPCVIEYSLICAAVCYVMWSNTGKNPHHRHITGTKSHPDLGSLDQKHSYYMDCTGAFKGLFVGLLVIILTSLSLILFFVHFHDPEYLGVAMIEMLISELSLYVVSTLATLIGFYQMRKLKYNEDHELELDSILLCIAQTGIYLFAMFVLISDFFVSGSLDSIGILTGSTMMFQATLQTMFILNGSERYTSTKEECKKKPGREMVTFLIFTNMSLWAINVFETARSSVHPIQSEFLGGLPWIIVLHISMPLTIFYRFHSTVCLCDIWTHVYTEKD